MPEEISGSPAVLPDDQPTLADGVPAADPAIEIEPDIINSVRTITVSQGELRRLAAIDSCLLRLQRELAAAEAEVMPSKAQIEAAKKRLLMAHQQLSQAQSAREKRAAEVKMLKAKIFHRLTTIADKEESRKVRAIRGRIAPQFRGETLSG